MQQLSLWDVPAKQSAKIPVFRVIIKTKLYVSERGRLLEQWLDTVDFVLFTVEGSITDDELKAAYTITRQQGIRVKYSLWRNHCPELYDRELIFAIDGGHAWQSMDVKAWKAFSKTQAKTKVVQTRTDCSYLAKTGVLG